MRFTALRVIALGATVGLGACNPYRCAVEYRSATFEGRLGDSAVAVVPATHAVPGRVFVGLDQWVGSQDQHQINLSFNYVTFADSVQEIVLTRASDSERAPLATFDAQQGYAVRDSFFNLWPQLTTRAVVDGLRAAFLSGDGMLVLIPHAPRAPVAARLKPTLQSDYAAACT